VLAGDQEMVKGVLCPYRSAIREINTLGQTPIHLVVGQPSYLLLLAAKADPLVINQQIWAGFGLLTTPYYRAQSSANVSSALSIKLVGVRTPLIDATTSHTTIL
jgi:hypothetical protein